jgi:hypothetical protein
MALARQRAAKILQNTRCHDLVGRIALMHVPGDDFVDTIHVPGLLNPRSSSSV